MARPASPGPERGPVRRAVAGWYHVTVIAGAIAFMLWSRLRARGRFTATEGVVLRGIDSYYQFRTTLYTVKNWPRTMPYDVWTAFPDGRYVGQFGTAYDQLVATTALIAGGGAPATALVHEIALLIVPALAALIVVPIYGIGRRLGGRLGGVVAVILIALFPGQIFTRTLTGQFQHHGAEMLFMSCAIFAFLAALGTARQHRLDRQGFLRGTRPVEHRTILSAALAGVALALYQWVWPPGILLVGVLGVFFGGYLMVMYTRGRSVAGIALVGVVSMTVAGVLILGTIERMSASPTSLGYLSPVLSFAIAGGCGGMAWLAWQWDRLAWSRWSYAATVIGSLGLLLLVVWMVSPHVIGRIVQPAIGRLVPIGHGQGTLSIAEASPPDDYTARVGREFGLSFYPALVGLLGTVVAVGLDPDRRAERTLIVVWALFILSMSTAQVRFFYYLALVVAVLNAALVGQLRQRIDLGQVLADRSPLDIGLVLVVSALVLVLVVPLLPGAAPGPTVFSMGSGPHDATLRWQDSLAYLSDGTPPVGQYDGGDSALAYYGTYEVPADGSYEYPPGAYGILSWWTYGHLITVESHRIPHANPFQDGAASSAAYLLAESERRANLILDALPTGARVTDRETEELEAIVANRTPQERQEAVRYVMIDAPMVTDAFGTITPWAGPDREEYVVEERVFLGRGVEDEPRLDRMGRDFHNTTLASLYLHDADGMGQYRLVHESERTTSIGSVANRTRRGQWETVATNVDFSNLEVGPEYLRSLAGFAVYDMFWDVPVVKTFERVPGATITGEVAAEPGSRVLVELDLRAAPTGRNFTYSRATTVRENGTFALTVPYATTEELGPADGFTETAVRAKRNYSVEVLEGFYVVERGTVSVPEPAIYEGEQRVVTLEPTRHAEASSPRMGTAGQTRSPAAQ